MKNIFAFFLCITTLFSLTACKKQDSKKCHSCGNFIPVAAAFCEYCGTKAQIGISNDNTTGNTENNITDHYDIPRISSNSQLLDTNWEATKIRMEQYLYGPNENLNNIAKSNLYLCNIDSVNCYMDLSTHSDIIGVVNSQIVFWGTYPLTQCAVKELLPDDALTSSPYMAYTDNGKNAYVWELQNGYLMIVALSSNSLSWHNQRAFCVVHTKDLHYLAPLNTTNENNIVQNSNGTITGTIEKNNGDFPSWRITLDNPINVEDWDGKHSCDVLYFYEDAKLNGLPISEYAGKSVSLQGTPENYRGGGQWFIYDPVLVN